MAKFQSNLLCINKFLFSVGCFLLSQNLSVITNSKAKICKSFTVGNSRIVHLNFSHGVRRNFISSLEKHWSSFIEWGKPIFLNLHVLFWANYCLHVATFKIYTHIHLNMQSLSPAEQKEKSFHITLALDILALSAVNDY